jgi:hypothetical protein
VITREPLYAALFDLWPTILDGIVTRERRLIHWSEVAANQQPALFQVEADAIPERRKGLPTKWTLGARLWLYTNCGNDSRAIASVQVNNMLDVIERGLDYDLNNGFQTLGGLVDEVRLAGHLSVDEGALGAQTVTQIFIEMVVA